MNPDRPNRAPEIKAALTDVRRVCDALGLTSEGGKTVQRQASGLIVRCPNHQENTPSCSVRLASDGTIAVKCFGCDWGSDVLGLIGAVRGIPLSGPGFRDVLAEGARLAGLWTLVDELEGRATGPEMPRPATQPAQNGPAQTRSYPDRVEVFWRDLDPVSRDESACSYLRSRSIEPDRVEARDLARVLAPDTEMPLWARCRGGTWREAAYRIVVPMFDAQGALCSVRGWRVGGDPDLPKRIPPSGCKASELVMADPFALAMLRGERAPPRVVISEGEPDFLTWATRLNDPSIAVVGIVSGSWSVAFAERIPIGCRVDVRTDHDSAGQRYFDEIESTLRRRAFVFRSRQEAA